MKMKSKATQHLLTIGLLFGLAFLGMLEPAMAERNPKIHVLFVWGTNATDTRQNCLQSRETFENCMADMGIRSGGKYIASFTSLSGDDAHPKNILEHCQRMAQQAGPDDALFVYILSHGGFVYPNNAPKTKDYLIHVLSPLASDAEHMNLRVFGIKRSSIIKAMKGGNHRLNVLITDSCSALVKSSYPEIIKDLGFSYINSFLLNANGTINWNSYDPTGGRNGTGELAIGLMNGTLFSHVFIEETGKDFRMKRESTINDLFNLVGSRLADAYKERMEDVWQRRGDYHVLQRYQDQQTLTEFDDDGHVIRRWNKNNDNPDESETNPQLSQRSDAGKLYVISVWGTGDSNQEKIVEASRKKFDAAMKQCGLSLKSDNDAGNFVAEYITLAGKNATRKNVLKTCKDVSLQAKKNDVIFVYMLCNGCTKAIHFKANQDGHSAAPVRGHFLFPGVENISQALENPKKYGILRSEIIQALKPNDHRLVVLITDAPSVYSDDGVFLLSNKKISDKMVIFSNSNAVCYDPVPLKSFDYSGNPDYRLRVFLRNTTGIIDWNSSSPNKGIYRLGEYSFANNAGSLFTQAFANFACKQTDSNIVARADDFYALLGSVLADSYNEFKTKTRKTDDNNILLRQEQQTLTEFSNGVSIKREWSKDYLHEEVDIEF